jgi:hypothetical protein
MAMTELMEEKDSVFLKCLTQYYAVLQICNSKLILQGGQKTQDESQLWPEATDTNELFCFFVRE